MATIERHPTASRGLSVPWQIGLSLTDTLWLVVAIAVSFLTRLPFFAVPMTADEGDYAYLAERWFRGEGQLYQDLWITRPQGILVVYGAIIHFFGNDIVAIRLAAWAVVALTLVTVWAFARRAFGARVATLSAMLFALLSGSPMLEGFTANAELFAALPSAIMVWMLFRAYRQHFPGGMLLLVGALAGAATLLKPTSAVMFACAVCFLWWCEPRAIGRLIGRAGWTSLGFMSLISLSLLHGVMIGWDDYWFATIEFRSQYQNAATMSFEQSWQSFRMLMSTQQHLLLAMVITILFALLSGARRKSRSDAASADGMAKVLLYLWCGWSLIGIVAGGDWWPHYMIQAAGPVAIWFAVYLGAIRQALVGALSWAPAAVVILLLLGPYQVIANEGTNAELIGDSLYSISKSSALKAAATYVRDQTEPNQTVYAAFSQAQFYVLAERSSATRFLYGNELERYPVGVAELIATIESPGRPEIVVDFDLKCRCQFPEISKIFWEVIPRYYRLETTIQGIDIYRRI